jgi:hypothetical protein
MRIRDTKSKDEKIKKFVNYKIKQKNIEKMHQYLKKIENGK